MRGLGTLVAGAGLLAVGLGMAAGLRGPNAVAAQGANAQTEPPVTRPSVSEVRAGRELFQVQCSSCHGLNGEGSPQGLSLVGVGAASADFYLTTGRMPRDATSGQGQRKPPAYSPREIRQLVAYVASLGPGPPIPRVSLSDGKLPEGLELFANNCAPCHSSAGAGGALGGGNYAPRLAPATPTQVAEAIRIGPGPMPVFGPELFSNHQLNSIVRYVEYLKDPEDRGGLGLGHLGPIPEGFVAWVVGLGLLVLAARWIGTRD